MQGRSQEMPPRSHALAWERTGQPPVQPV